QAEGRRVVPGVLRRGGRTPAVAAERGADGWRTRGDREWTKRRVMEGERSQGSRPRRRNRWLGEAKCPHAGAASARREQPVADRAHAPARRAARRGDAGGGSAERLDRGGGPGSRRLLGPLAALPDAPRWGRVLRGTAALAGAGPAGAGGDPGGAGRRGGRRPAP